MESGKPDPPEPLKASEDSMAHHTIRGFVYQILRSVLTWITLPSETQVLYLECAEDFDITELSQVNTVQIKDSSRAFSLRSEEIHRFLNRWWTSCESNKDRTIRSAFITTGSFAVERESTFSEPALEIWSKASTIDDIENLRSLILTCAKLSSSFRVFIENLSTAKFKSEFLDMINWTRNADKSVQVIERIQRELRQMLDTKGVHSDCWENVFGRLYSYVSMVTTKAEVIDRTLTCATLEMLVQEVLETTLPRKEFSELEHRVSSVEEMVSKVMKSISGGSAVLIQTSILKQICGAPGWYLPREKVLHSLMSGLQQSKLLVITGLKGSGKTILSRVAACQFSEEVWFSVDMAANERTRVSDRLEIVASLVHRSPKFDGLVLDDFSFRKTCNEIPGFQVASIIDSIISSGIRVIITTCESTPISFSNALIHPALIEPIPLVSPDEMDMWISKSGCQAKFVKLWRLILQSQTGCHPRLLHARLVSLKKENWPKPDLEKFGSTPIEIANLRREERNYASSLPYPEKDLLYRLSLFKGRFNRVTALRVAGIEPELPYPGDAFDALRGPWIFEVESGSCKVTPTLFNEAVQVWDSNQVEFLHSSIAEIFLMQTEVDIDTLSSAVLHACDGRNKEVFMKSIMSILSCSADYRKTADRAFSWLIYVSAPALSEKLGLSTAEACIFHNLRFRIANSQNSSNISEIALQWKMDVDALPESKQTLTLRIQCYTQLITFWETQPSDLFTMLIDLSKALERKSSLGEQEDSDYEFEIPKWIEEGLFRAMMPAILVKCRSCIELRLLLNSIYELDGTQRRQCLSLFIDNEPYARSFVDSIWIGESKLAKPNWDECSSLLFETLVLARDLGICEIAVAVGRALAIVVGEYIGDLDRARLLLKDIEAEFGESYLIHDGRAALCYLSGDRIGSLEEVRTSQRLLDEYPIDDESISMLSARQAGIAASKEQLWEFAQSFFLTAASAALKLNLTPQYFGLLVDAAYSLWKLGQIGDSITLLDKAFDLLSDVQTRQECHSQIRLAGIVLLAMQSEITSIRVEQEIEIVPGMCGNPEPDNRILSLPPVPQDLCWAIIADLASQTGECLDIVSKAESIIARGRFPFAHLSISSSLYRKALREGDFHSLPRIRLKMLRSLSFSELATSKGFTANDEIDEDLPGEPLTQSSIRKSVVPVLAGLMIAHLNDYPCLKYLKDWQSSLKEGDPLVGAINIAQYIMKMPEQEIRKRMTDSSYTETERLLSATACLSINSLTPEILWICHYYLFSKFDEDGILNLMSPWLADLFIVQWKYKVKSAFLLRNPRVTVPEILATLKKRFPNPIVQCASILLSSSNAAKVRIPSGFLDLLISRIKENT